MISVEHGFDKEGPIHTHIFKGDPLEATTFNGVLQVTSGKDVYTYAPGYWRLVREAGNTETCQ